MTNERFKDHKTENHAARFRRQVNCGLGGQDLEANYLSSDCGVAESITAVKVHGSPPTTLQPWFVPR